MGPRSDNRGYGPDGMTSNGPQERETTLQWVHGPITVVMRYRGATQVSSGNALQWVHGPITVVMGDLTCCRKTAARWASMGPRSDNRGYGGSRPGSGRGTCSFNGSTVR